MAAPRLRRRVLLVALAVLACLPLVPLAWVYRASAGYRSTVADVPPAPVGLVLGAALNRQGRPSPVLAARLDLAARLYAEGKVRVLLVSGRRSGIRHDEPAAMRAYLVERGVPASSVRTDGGGVTTWDSCLRARTLFGVARVVVVTQTFHLPRAVALCRMAGIDAYGVGDDSAGDLPLVTAYGYVREVVADGKAVWTVFTVRRAAAPPDSASSGR
jgi:vancomycin permeability regulator SanA